VACTRQARPDVRIAVNPSEVCVPLLNDNPVIAVVGSLNIDLIAYTERVPQAGETLIGTDFRMGFGGKGANQAVMAARLGGRVSMVGALGSDVYADMTFENLERQGIDASHVARVDGSSGVAPIWVEAGGQNRIIVVPGANDKVGPDAAADAVRSTPGVRVVIGQLEIPQRVTLAAFRAARDVGATTILNPAPAAALDPALLDVTDWLIPNETELGRVAGQPIDLDDDAGFLRYAGTLGSRLLVTLGERGAAVIGADGLERVPAARVAAVDTTGAGDAFVGAFAFGLAAGLDDLAAVRLGIACASDSVTRHGTQSSYAGPAEARKILEGVLGR
jgi:ribokinase